jgi:hypothetical protein
MDNVQNCDSYINTPSSQIYRSRSYWAEQTALFLRKPKCRYIMFTGALNCFAALSYISQTVILLTSFLRPFSCHHSIYAQSPVWSALFRFSDWNYVRISPLFHACSYTAHTIALDILSLTIQGAYNETPLFWRCFKNRQICSGVKGLLRITRVQILLRLRVWYLLIIMPYLYCYFLRKR